MTSVFDCQLQSFSADHHSIYLDSRGGNPASEPEVIADHRDSAQHIAEIAGDSDLFDPEGQLAVFDPPAGSAAREIAGDRIEAEAYHLGHVKTVLDRSDDLVRPIDAGSDEKVAEPDRRRANQSARGVRRRAQTEFARGVGIEQIIFQNP